MACPPLLLDQLRPPVLLRYNKREKSHPFMFPSMHRAASATRTHARLVFSTKRLSIVYGQKCCVRRHVRRFRVDVESTGSRRREFHDSRVGRKFGTRRKRRAFVSPRTARNARATRWHSVLASTREKTRSSHASIADARLFFFSFFLLFFFESAGIGARRLSVADTSQQRSAIKGNPF